MLAACVGLGCSLTTVDREPCTDSTTCRAGFGLGSVCEEGFCRPLEPLDRCGRSFPEDLLAEPEAYADHIVIGSIYDFNDHVDTLLATELAVRQVNQRSGLDGVPFAVLHCDYAAMAGDQLDDVESTRLISGYLAREIGVPAIVGPRGSARTEAAFTEIRDDGVLLISPSATSPALTALDGTSPTDELPGLLWRTAPPDSLQSEVIAADMHDRGVVHPAVIYQTGAYGDGLRELFVERFVEGGGEEPELFPFSDGDFSTGLAEVADAIAAGEVDEVLFVSSDIADYVAFFTAAIATDELVAAFDSPDVGIFLADAAFASALLEEVPTQAHALFDTVRGTRPAPAMGALFNAFAAAYAAEFSADPASSAFNPHAYDAGWLVAYGAAWSHLNEGGISGLGIARGLRKVSSGPTIEIQPADWPALVERFRTGEGVDVEGASGPLDYDPADEETVAPIELWQIVAAPETVSGFDFSAIARIDP
jgi:branched-chain amino acid transport system substrate-binding protein